MHPAWVGVSWRAGVALSRGCSAPGWTGGSAPRPSSSCLGTAALRIFHVGTNICGIPCFSATTKIQQNHSNEKQDFLEVAHGVGSGGPRACARMSVSKPRTSLPFCPLLSTYLSPFFVFAFCFSLPAACSAGTDCGAQGPQPPPGGRAGKSWRVGWVCPSSHRAAGLGTAHHPPGCQAHPMSRGRVDGEASAPHEAVGSQGSTTPLPEEGGGSLRPGGPCILSKQQRHEWKVRPGRVRVAHRICRRGPTLTETGMLAEGLGE